MGEMDEAVQERPIDTGDPPVTVRLARRLPWAVPLLFALGPGGVVAFWGWYRLANGRLHAFEYWCYWLMVLSVLIGLFGLVAGEVLRREVHGDAPRWIKRCTGGLFAFAVLVMLYLAAQLACWTLNTRAAARIVRDGTHSVGASFQSSRILGHMPRAGVTAGARLLVDGEEIFNYTYRTDQVRRRITPDSAAPSAEGRALVFLGCSYTFGEGVNDDETLPNQTARLLPEWTLYNYAFSGYGPNHVLARLESLDTRKDIAEQQVVGIYVFIPDHVRRVIGAYSVNNWSRHSPYYRLGPDGVPERLGSFQGERPGLTRLYDILKGDHVLQYFRMDLPPRLRERDFALTIGLIEACARRWREQFPGAPFYVLLYPSTPNNEFPATEMGPRLRERGLTVLDYTNILSGPAEDYFYLPHDSHPRPAAHAAVATRLVGELFPPEGAQRP